MWRCVLLAFVVGCYEPPRCAVACTTDADCPGGESCTRGVCIDPQVACPTQTIDIVLDNSASFAALDGMPVLVSLGATSNYGAVVDPSIDLHFRDASAADLPFDVDHWDPAGTAAVWVKVAHVPARSTDTIVTMTYGPDAKGAADPATVWSAYEAAWHMTKSDRVVEATGRHSATVPGGTTWGTGQIGGSLELGPTDSRVDPSNAGVLFDGWGAFTLEMWLRPDYDPTDTIDAAVMIDKGGALTGGRVFRNPDGSLALQIDWHFANHDEFLNTGVDPHLWTQIVYTFDGRTLSLYRNGQLDGTAGNYPTPEPLVSGTSALSLGAMNQPMKGAIDEVRIAKTTMSADWVRAQYLTAIGVFAKLRP